MKKTKRVRRLKEAKRLLRSERGLLGLRKVPWQKLNKQHLRMQRIMAVSNTGVLIAD